MRSNLAGITILIMAVILVGVSYIAWSSLPVKLPFSTQFATYTHGAIWLVPTANIDLELSSDNKIATFTVGSAEIVYSVDVELIPSMDAILGQYATAAGDKYLFSQQTCPMLGVISIPNVVNASHRLDQLRTLNCYTSTTWQENGFTR